MNFLVDAILLAGARGGRNKHHSRRHALRLTLLVDFADENYPNPGRKPFESWTIFVRGLVQPPDGEGATLAKQALPLKGTRVLCCA
jgi:hypothetical protein